MLYRNAICEMPDPETKIWRYMDFTKLVSMIDKNALYFSAIDSLEDPLEGSLTEKNVEDRRNFDKFLAQMEENNLLKRSTSKGFNIHEAMRELRKHMFVNCWHINEEESAAMWKLYLKSDEGIAIESTSKRLESNLDKIDVD